MQYIAYAYKVKDGYKLELKESPTQRHYVTAYHCPDMRAVRKMCVSWNAKPWNF